jgi:hypothetical protein
MVKRMVNHTTIAAALILSLIASGCAVEQTSSPVTPSPDKPTFVYFYTDG